MPEPDDTARGRAEFVGEHSSVHDYFKSPARARGKRRLSLAARLEAVQRRFEDDGRYCHEIEGNRIYRVNVVQAIDPDAPRCK